MNLSVICYENKISETLFAELSKIKFGLKVFKSGDFNLTDSFLSKIKLKRKILSAISEALDNEVDYIVLYLREDLGNFDFISEFTDAPIYRINFNEVSTEDELLKEIIKLREKISSDIDHKLFQMYEMEGCGCSACRSAESKK